LQSADIKAQHKSNRKSGSVLLLDRPLAPEDEYSPENRFFRLEASADIFKNIVREAESQSDEVHLLAVSTCCTNPSFVCLQASVSLCLCVIFQALARKRTQLLVSENAKVTKWPLLVALHGYSVA
jgi:hypothetical protein